MSLRRATACCGLLFGPLLLVAVPEVRAQTVGLNFTGVTSPQGALLNGNSGYAPPDNAGAVGPTQVVQLINGAFAVYNKSDGTPEPAISGRDFWLNAGVDPGTSIANLGAFNQRIIYDPSSGRWIAAALTGETENNRVLLARSESSDALGPWKAVSFLGNVGGEGKFVDYTALGLDANGVYIATNTYTSNTPEGGVDSAALFSVPKADLLAPTPTLAGMSRFDGLNKGIDYVGWTLQPIVNFGAVGNQAPVLATSGAMTDSYLFRSDLTGTAAAGATYTTNATWIEVDPYTFPPDAAQPDGTQVIGLLDSRFKSQVTQVGDTMYAVHDVLSGGHSAIEWYKIDEATNQVIQQGLLSDPNFDFYQASIAANANGDIVIGFNRSGLGLDGNISIFAALGTTLAGVTTFGDPLLLKAGLVDDYHYVNNRWGDYTTTVVDPSNPNVFWTFQEIPLAADAWATNITQIIVPEPSAGMLAAIALAVALAARYRGRRREAKPGICTGKAPFGSQWNDRTPIRRAAAGRVGVAQPTVQ